MLPLFIPAPPFRDIDLGRLTIHMYSLTMITAMLLSWWWTGRRIAARGGNRDEWDGMALVAVVFGIIGARAYHVITEHARYFGPGLDPWNALKIWNGGLGVIGSIVGGGLAVLVYCRVKHVNFAGIADCIAPTLLAAQAWGRVGNWFNQEAFGRPTTLPWALKVDPQYRPLGYQQYATFHPTFLYEGLWNVIGILVLIFILERHFHLGKGKLFVSYVLWYTFGRFFIELIRIDPVDKVDGIRINDWTSGAIFIGA
ncbi:MAG: prolipoprotein diacylglyceryl transferase, partial [Propionibacteriaceae bacterium]|nr:prolipoprotein diacylglyceryl transferase [Propionibacteriaceae bacterium]